MSTRGLRQADLSRLPWHVRVRLHAGLPITARWRKAAIDEVSSPAWATRRAVYLTALLALFIVPQLAWGSWSGWSRLLPAAMWCLAIVVNFALRERNRRMVLRALRTGRFGPLDTPMRWWDLPLAFAIGGVVVLLLFVFVGAR